MSRDRRRTGSFSIAPRLALGAILAPCDGHGAWRAQQRSRQPQQGRSLLCAALRCGWGATDDELGTTLAGNDLPGTSYQGIFRAAKSSKRHTSGRTTRWSERMRSLSGKDGWASSSQPNMNVQPDRALSGLRSRINKSRGRLARSTPSRISRGWYRGLLKHRGW